MSLNWNLEKIKDADAVCWIGEKGDETMNPVTNAIIWMTMGVGLGAITEKNHTEFYARMKMTDALHGAPLNTHEKGKPPKPRFITLDEIKAHIGLSTNVTDEKRGVWGKRIVEGFVSAEEYRARSAKK